MFILGKRWQAGYLDYHRSEGELRVRVRVWWPLERLRDVFLEQPRSFHRLWHYYREVGLRELARKVRSRMRETLRDRRFVCLGAGEVLETDEDADIGPGSPVAFVAPSHPECVERVVLPQEFTLPIPAELLTRLSRPEGVCLYRAATPSETLRWDDVAGWSRHSGIDVGGAVRALLPLACDALGGLDRATAEVLPLPEATSIRERSASLPPKHGTLTAVLFGLGNYAKTCIIPNVSPQIQFQCVHEIDPLQIGTLSGQTPSYDTSDSIRPDQHYDVYFIAGYHHTHADLAVHALRSGSWVVVEKPLVTTRSQLERLVAAMREHPGRLFAGFQKRYNPANELARQDLQLTPGEPVNYHCIVFEVPLVRRHWYNWPNSRSRIVSNGCHWLDHFLFMNDFCPPQRWNLWKARNGDMHVSVELENGATFSMSLTDHGSRRIGVQQRVELRAKGVTVHVDNDRGYMSEDRYRIIRRKRIKRMSAIRRMYRTISQRIAAGEPGDPLDAVQRSCELMLAVDEVHASS